MLPTLVLLSQFCTPSVLNKRRVQQPILHSFLPLIRPYLNSPIFKVRKLVAKVLAPLLDLPTLDLYVKTEIKAVESDSEFKANKLHGVLLTLKYFLVLHRRLKRGVPSPCLILLNSLISALSRGEILRVFPIHTTLWDSFLIAIELSRIRCNSETVRKLRGTDGPDGINPLNVSEIEETVAKFVSWYELNANVFRVVPCFDEALESAKRLLALLNGNS